ncbi:hypothetical protein [Kordia jejudonensis]|uniref:hypothetical protein n=1 Tax=Kordia jejudonensis TaxID=1348245 RepID=UPI00062904F5|nr:hypothetical protein [Kordia jejudonensis]
MKKQKSLDALQKSLMKNKKIVGVDSAGNTIQYWCGLSVIGGDFGQASTGSSMDELISIWDWSDRPKSSTVN